MIIPNILPKAAHPRHLCRSRATHHLTMRPSPEYAYPFPRSGVTQQFPPDRPAPAIATPARSIQPAQDIRRPATSTQGEPGGAPGYPGAEPSPLLNLAARFPGTGVAVRSLALAAGLGGSAPLWQPLWPGTHLDNISSPTAKLRCFFAGSAYACSNMVMV